MPNIEWTSALICPANPKKQQFFGECEEWHQFFSVNILGGKQTNVLIFWSSLSTGAGTVVIFMFRGHVSGCLKVSRSSCGCLEKMPPIFRWNMRHVPENVWGFHTQKKKHPVIPWYFQIMVMFYFADWNPQRMPTQIWSGTPMRMINFAHDVGGNQLAKQKPSRLQWLYLRKLTVRPSKMDSLKPDFPDLLSTKFHLPRGKIPSLKLTAKAPEKWWPREPIRLPFLGYVAYFQGAIYVSFSEGNPDHQQELRCGPKMLIVVVLQNTFRLVKWTRLQLAGRVPRFIDIKTPKTSKTSMFLMVALSSFNMIFLGKGWNNGCLEE